MVACKEGENYVITFHDEHLSFTERNKFRKRLDKIIMSIKEKQND